MWSEEIWLVITEYGVDRMTKRQPSLKRGEVPVKLVVEVDPNALKPPTLIRQVRIADWREGVDMGDLEIAAGVITEDEAQTIRAQRIAQQVERLRAMGYKVEGPAVEPPEEVAGHWRPSPEA